MQYMMLLYSTNLKFAPCRKRSWYRATYIAYTRYVF